MIHYEVFCPVERVCSLIKERAKDAGFDSIMVKANDLPIMRKEFAISCNAPVNFALGLSVQERINVSALDSWEAEALCFHKDGSYITKHVVVQQCLVTDAPALNYVTRTIDGVQKKLVNGELADGKPVCYPEAIDTVYPKNSYVESDYGPIKYGCEGRPYYNYLLRGRSEDSFLIFGPKAIKPYQKYASIKLGERSYSIITEDVRDVAESLNTVKTTPVVDSNRIITYLRYKDQLHEFVFGQINSFIDGRPFFGYELLKLLKGITFFELNNFRGQHAANTVFDGYDPNSRTLIVDVEDTERYFKLDAKFQSFYDVYVSQNVDVKELFAQYDADTVSVRLFESSSPAGYPVGKSAPIIGLSHVQSCFALSLAYLVTSESDHALMDMIAALRSLLNRLLIINNEGVLEGTTGATINGNAKSVPIDLYAGVYNMSLQRADASLSKVTDGYVIVAWDKDNDPQTIEHYFVGKVVNGSIFLEYDPWLKTRKRYGENVSDLATTRGSYCITFTGDVKKNLEEVSLADIGFAQVA